MFTQSGDLLIDLQPEAVVFNWAFKPLFGVVLVTGVLKRNH